MVTVKAAECFSFSSKKHHIYIEIRINSGNTTKHYLNTSFEIAKFLNIDLKQYINRHKSFMAKLGYTEYTFISLDVNSIDDIEFLVETSMTKDKLVQVKEAFEKEFLKELTMVALT